MFISQCCGCRSEDQILQSVSMCDKHNTEYKYLCLNKQEKCMGDPLACQNCLEQHKGHQFMIIQNYFTPEFRDILKTGTSLNGRSVARLYQHVLTDIQKMRSVLNREIDKLQNIANAQIQKLKVKYPLKNKFGIPGRDINKQNIVFLMTLVQRQKNHIWVPATERYIRTIMGEVTGMLGNLLNDLSEHVEGQNYQKYTQKFSEERINTFVKKYQGKYDPDRTHFQFSLFEKHQNIRIFQNGIIAKFIDTNPSKPAVLSDSPFDKKNHTFYIKIIKLEKTAVVFDASVVFIGVSLAHTASIFGFRNLIQPSHGAFLIGSNGKTYHSNIEKYNKQSLSFGFGQGDTISVRVDFQQKKVHFSKWGFFVRNFSMEIDVKEQDLYRLRACVSFHGQKGVLVQIVDQDVFMLKQQEIKYQV